MWNSFPGGTGGQGGLGIIECKTISIRTRDNRPIFECRVKNSLPRQNGDTGRTGTAGQSWVFSYKHSNVNFWQSPYKFKNLIYFFDSFDWSRCRWNSRAIVSHKAEPWSQCHQQVSIGLNQNNAKIGRGSCLGKWPTHGRRNFKFHYYPNKRQARCFRP